MISQENSNFLNPTGNEPEEQHGKIRPQEEQDKPYGGWAGWPGDGSGLDDFADFNSLEGEDF